MSNTLTPEQAAELFKTATTSATKWAFLDGVADMVAAHGDKTQKEVVDMIGDTSTFIGLHGHFRDTAKGGKARSKLKSIRDELAVVKVWSPSDRVDGVSFEAHKVLNRLGAKDGGKLLASLVKEMGGPGNVTKAAVTARLKVADPDHVPQANGKSGSASTPAPSGGNPTVTKDISEFDTIELAEALANKLTVGDLSKDTTLAATVEKIADVFEAFSQRNAAKAAGAKKAAAKKAAAQPKKRKAPAKPNAKTGGVRTPKKAAASKPKRPAVKAPAVKAPSSK